jgi:ornithine cyclodeaminase/alanine dehydrogenase-like protein (mu-crystallin family)
VSKDTVLLSQSDVAQCTSVPEVVRTVEAVFAAHGRGAVSMPAKINLDLSASGEPNWINAMPAYIPDLRAGGIKWAGGFMNNAARGLRYVMATIILNDPITGVPDAVLDGVWITNARTGAVVAVSTKYLSRPGPKEIALVGAGTQARATLRAMHGYIDVAAVRVTDHNAKTLASFVAEMATAELAITATDSVEQAVRGADVIVTVTTADAPLVNLEWVKPGAYIASMGSYQELEESVVLQASKIVVDSWEQTAHRGELRKLAEAGRLRRDRIHAEIGEVVTGRKTGWEPSDQHVLGVLIGLGSLDIAVARLVLERARERGLGRAFDFLA